MDEHHSSVPIAGDGWGGAEMKDPIPVTPSSPSLHRAARWVINETSPVAD